MENRRIFVIALVSIFIYTFLGTVCLYYASTFWNFEKNECQGGRYAQPKLLFYFVLGVGALLDLPTFIGCVSHGGPSSCVWNNVSYAFCWCCHLVATCGYAFAIITPSILWSDIIQRKDGHFWNSSSPLDSLKIFFRVVYGIYCCVILMTIVGVIMYSKSSNESEYSDSSDLGAIGNILTPSILFVITIGCLWSGWQLHEHIKSVQLGTDLQLKILRKLNRTMILIASTYGVRVILCMSLYGEMPHWYIHTFKVTQYYPLWLILTQWFPYVLCSLFLVYSMRFKDDEKSGSNRSASIDNTGADEDQSSRIEKAQVPSNDSNSGQDMFVSLKGTTTSGRLGFGWDSCTSFVDSSRETPRASELDITVSPFEHSVSKDGTPTLYVTKEKPNRELDALLAIAEKSRAKNISKDDNFGSPADSSYIDHFFSANALVRMSQASSNQSTVHTVNADVPGSCNIRL